jgi:predicted secreted hydrolase
MMRAALTGWLPVVAGLGIGAAMAGAPVPPPAASAPGPAGFAPAVTPRSFLFPRDHGPHESFRQEWWYLTGNLDGAGGQRLGFELTFFRFALQPPAAAAEPAAQSAWRTRQIYMAHFAITDVAAQRFSFAQKLSREALGLAGAQGEPLRVWIDDWSLQGAMANAATIRADGSWSVHAAQEGYELELTLQALTAPVLNGEAGLSRKSSAPADASYYYSIPRLAARGVLTRDGRALPVQGLAWFDREWGSAQLNARQAGWDWFALQLQDGSALMFYALRARGGGRDPHSAGTWLETSGQTRRLGDPQVDVEVLDHWKSAHGTVYPSGWRIRVPSLALELSVRPVLADQELTGTPAYWEGAVDVAGTRAGQKLGGRGYVELVGYAAERSPPGATGAPARLGR